MQDEAFHEIQLNGKQLVFLFMAATVVSVVIFLCGVLVGRGVRAERAAAGQEAQESMTSASAPDTSSPHVAAVPAPAPAGSDPTTAAPPTPVDDLSYFSRLEKEKAPAEQLKPITAKSAQRAPVDTPSHPEPAAAKARESGSDPGSQPWTVQVAALNVRTEAEAIARRMTSKGYPAYVVPSPDGTSVFRVRVGKFSTRHDAETLKSRLEREEQFKPWITR